MSSSSSSVCDLSSSSDSHTHTTTTDPSRYDLVDIAAILTHGKFTDVIPQVIKRAVSAGVNRIIIPAMDIPSAQLAAQIAFKYSDNISFLAGVHPHCADAWTSKSESELQHLMRLDSCVGIGECGLDWHRKFVSRQQQIKVFEEQVHLACRFQKPLLVHCRDSTADIVAILSRYHAKLPPVVVHCISAASVQPIVNIGCFVGITGALLKDHKLREMLRYGELSLDSVMLETDSPYMYPGCFDNRVSPRDIRAVTYTSRAFLEEIRWRHTGNEPCSLPFLVEVVAGCTGISPERVAEITTQNCRVFFNF